MMTHLAPRTKVEVINDNFSHIRCKGWVGTVCEEQPHPTLTLVYFPWLPEDDQTIFFGEGEIRDMGEMGEFVKVQRE